MPIGLLRAALLSSWLMLACTARVQAQTAPQSTSEQSLKDDQEARSLFNRGKEAFDEARFERALMYFKDAYELSHRATLLSNIGAALDRLRRDAEALDAYKQYLDQVPDAPNRAFVEERVRIIEGAQVKASPPLAAQGAAQTTPETSPAVVLTPRAAAQSLPETTAAPAAVSDNVKPAQSEGASLTSRWWFWAGLGAVAAAAVVVGVSVSSGAGTQSESPAVSNTDTRIRAL